MLEIYIDYFVFMMHLYAAMVLVKETCKYIFHRFFVILDEKNTLPA